MKEKILVALKTKYKTFGFGDKAFDGVADYLSKTVTEESQLETAISGVEGLLKAFQGDIDTVRNEKSGLQKQLDELKAKTGNPNPTQKPEDKKDDVPAWAKALIDSNKDLSDKLARLETEKSQATRQEQILAKAKEYGIPETLAKRYSIPEDADLDTYFKDAKQELANVGFQGVTPPESAEAKIEKEAESIAKTINEGTKQIVEQNKN
nr:MAG TPA: hypothetical protein [Caudoviricetes sp.]